MIISEDALRQKELNLNVRFPFGMPVGIDWVSIVQNIQLLDVIDIDIIEFIRKSKAGGKRKQHEFEKWYLDHSGHNWRSLSPKLKNVAFALAIPAIRHALLNNVVCDRPFESYKLFSYTPEGLLLSGYATAKGFDSIDSMASHYEIDKQSIYSVEDGLAKSLIGLCIRSMAAQSLPLLNKVCKLIYLLPEVVKDFGSPELKAEAFKAFFSIASVSATRALFDTLQRKHPKEFHKHYPHLMFEVNQVGKKDNPVYTNAFNNYNDDEFDKALIACNVKAQVLSTSKEFIPFLATIESYDDIPKLRNKLPLLRKNVNAEFAELERVILKVCDHESTSCIQNALNTLKNIDQTNTHLVLDNKKAEFSINQAIDSLNAFTDTSSEEGGKLFELASKFNLDFEQSSLSLIDTHNTITEIEEEIGNKLKHLPVSQHKAIVVPIYDKLEEANNAYSVEKKAKTESIVDSIQKIAEAKVNLIETLDQTNKAVPLEDKLLTERIFHKKQLAEHRSSLDNLEERLKIVTSDKRRMENKVQQLRSSVVFETENLTVLKNEQLIESITPSSRSLLKKVVLDINSCSLEELLLALSILYPEEVFVLDSAFKSARLSPFVNKTTLWKNLLVLVNEYLPVINQGKPDSEARQCFSLKMYAANESKTTESNAQAALLREGVYLGVQYHFFKHLRFGTARNSEETLRVHFDVIDSKIVIQHCGEHKKLVV
ncbi:MAG: hypothetical protein HAW67_03425 [Endozoicomonadaceae bacterium]|nr:hypothetical protein [Endozoicomonadaceae bacterium]